MAKRTAAQVARQKASVRKYAEQHRAELAAAQRARARANPVKVQRILWKSAYGLSDEQCDKAMALTNCPLCDKSFDAIFARGKHARCIDHDHVTGDVRGVICKKCNTMLGQAEDNPQILRRGIQYLSGELRNI